MEQVTVKGVDRGWDATQTGRDAAEDASLRRVRVDDVWSKRAHLSDEHGKRLHIRSRVGRSTQSAYPGQRKVGCSQRDVVRLIGADRTGVEPLVESVGIESLNKSCDLQSGTADVHACDNPHDSNPLGPRVRIPRHQTQPTGRYARRPGW
jgi:hypothetical protein